MSVIAVPFAASSVADPDDFLPDPVPDPTFEIIRIQT
jgi:hypothetical protein